MALTMRRTPLETSPAFADIEDWQVLDDGKPVGRIYERHAPGTTSQPWFWSITEYVEPRSGLRMSGTASSLLEAKVAFRANWDRWRSWATRTGFDRTRL
jgi:hypothetical protein